jgi:hypothetical protein
MTRVGRTVRLLLGAAVLQAATLAAEPVPVHQPEGMLRGFLALRTLDGDTLADGDVIQVASDDRVTCRVVFRFKDGSRSDETAVFSQRGHFRLISDHLVQAGPTFPHPVDVSIDGRTGQTTVRYANDEGTSKVSKEQLDLPADLANGMLITILKNIRPDRPLTSVSMVAATPTLRTVKLLIKPAGEDPLVIGGTPVTAMHYVVKVDVGGLPGFLAGLLGRQPPDAHVWILGGDAPAFVKSEAQLYAGGPLWRIELVSPTWPAPARRAATP